MKGITDKAGRVLLKTLQEENAPKDRCVRFVGTEHGGDLEIDKIHLDDEVYRYEGRPVFAVGPETADSCEEVRLDYESNHFTFV